jgi:uncharacterized cupin superfamily protein
MKPANPPLAVFGEEIPPRARPSNYPPAFAIRMQGREKRPLGDLFGLQSFGVNLTRLAPGAMSALRHAHARQDEFVYILSGFPTLVTDEGASLLEPGMCTGFAAGSGNAHHLVNRSDDDVVYLEIGDRATDDVVTYPDDDIVAIRTEAGGWRFTSKSGEAY